MNNRIIKFRIWYKTESRWLETPDGLFFKYPHSTSGEYVGDFMSDPYVPCQFTGLNDCHGTPIFDGDIVRYYFDKPEITYTELVAWEHFSWVLLSKEGSSCPLLRLENMEVVGNILEHAERF